MALAAAPVVIPPNPGASRRKLPNVESTPRNEGDLDMRHGAGTPVPFLVARRKVFAALRRAVGKLGVSVATAVATAPIVAVNLVELVATQPTVDPKVVQQFVDHPDAGRTGRKHHKDGRQIDLPLVIECNGCKYIYDGHHRCVAAVMRGETEVMVRLLRLRSLEQLKVLRAKVTRLGDSGDSNDSGDAKVPTEFCIFPMGKVDTSKGVFLFDKKAAKLVLKFYKDQGNDLSIDYEHMAVSDPPVIAPAAGYFDLELRRDGLWAVDVRWTPRAEKMLRKKEYKYFSPAFVADKDSGRICKLLNIALTNIPATKNMTPLIAARQLDSTMLLVKRGVIHASAIPAILVAAKKLRVDLLRMSSRRRYTRGIVTGLAKSGFSIQSLVFPKRHWKKIGARKWVKDHDFAPSVEETRSSFRFRQRDPGEFEQLATICLTPASAKAGDGSCKIRAVGGPLKKKAKASAEAVAEPMDDAAHSAAHKEEPMARQLKVKKVAAKGKKAVQQISANAPATKGNAPAAELQDASGKRVDLAAAAADAAVKTGIRQGAKTTSQVAAAAADSDSGDSGDSDSGDSGDSADSDSSGGAMAAADSKDSGDSDSGDAGDSDSGDSDSAALEAAADSGDSEDSDSDSDSDSDDSDDSDDDDSAELEATKKTPTNPDTSTPASQTAGKDKTGRKSKSVAAVVASITGTKKRDEQIGALHALGETRAELEKLSAKLERREKRERAEKLEGIVKQAVDNFRLAPSKRRKALRIGEKYGVKALRTFIKTFAGGRLVKNETTAAREADSSVKVIAATLTNADKEVMQRMGLTQDDFVATRMAQETKKRTGQGRGAH